jgi:hypothetical protein
MRYLSLALFFFLSMLFGCSSKCTCNEVSNNKSYRDTLPNLFKIDTQAIQVSKSIPKTKRPNFSFGFTIYNKKDVLYLTYVSLDGQLVFTNLYDSNQVFLSPFPLRATKKDFVMMRILGDTLHLINSKDTSYFKFVIKDDFSTDLVQKINLNSIVQEENWFVHFNNIGGKQFDYCYPYLVVPYGKRNGTNLYDDNACMLFDIKAKRVKKLLPFPECYNSCYLHNENVSVVVDTNKVLGLFSYFDLFSEVNIQSNAISQHELPWGEKFAEYDRNEIRNLAYVRKYEALNELNVNLFLLKDKSVIVVQRLSKKKISDPFQYRYFHFDLKSQPVSFGMLPESILNGLTIPYKSGFIVFNDSLSKSYYYEPV